MGPVEVLWDGDGVHPPPLPDGGQTENITSRRTTYAGGNYYLLEHADGNILFLIIRVTTRCVHKFNQSILLIHLN